MKEQRGITENSESGQAVAKQKFESGPNRFHVDHWRERIYQKTFTRDGVWHEVKEWSVRLQHLGRREAFALGTTNAAVAAFKAKELATFLDANGWVATLAKYKPSPLADAEICSVGEFMAAVKASRNLSRLTLIRYAIKFRKLMADLGRVETGMKKKDRRRKHDYRGGGRKAWLEKVDGLRLDILTPGSIDAWQKKYVGKAGDDPLKRKSAERSAASIMRCSRALFLPAVIGNLKVKLPPQPFAGVKIKSPKPPRFKSTVSAEYLLVCAERELRKDRPQLFLALVLCLWAGLRRKEADMLTWDQVDFEQGLIDIRITPVFKPKTDESERTVDMPADVMDVLRTFKQGCTSEFVLEGGAPDPSATVYYRANRMWRELHQWLRDKGVRDRKAVHALRKESGSLIASKFGIEAARQHLGHSDIRVTSAHYVDKKRRVEVSLPINAEPLRGAAS